MDADTFLWLAWADEVYFIALVAGVVTAAIAGVLAYAAESRRDERRDDLLRDILETQRSHGERISRIEMQHELEDAQESDSEAQDFDPSLVAELASQQALNTQAIGVHGERLDKLESEVE